MAGGLAHHGTIVKGHAGATTVQIDEIPAAQGLQPLGELLQGQTNGTQLGFLRTLTVINHQASSNHRSIK
jgi:hypothetical protein